MSLEADVYVVKIVHDYDDETGHSVSTWLEPPMHIIKASTTSSARSLIKILKDMGAKENNDGSLSIRGDRLSINNLELAFWIDEYNEDVFENCDWFKTKDYWWLCVTRCNRHCF